MRNLETEFNRLKVYDPTNKFELYISSKLLGYNSTVKTYNDISIRYSNKPVTNYAQLIGAMETLYDATHNDWDWVQHRQKVMTTYVKLVSCKERLLQKEIERERSLF